MYYNVWVSLSSRCNLSRDAAPCQSGNSLVVVQGTADSYNGDSYNYRSCLSGREGGDPAGYFIDGDGDVAFNAGHLVCCPAGGQIGHTGRIPVVFKLRFGPKNDAEISQLDYSRLTSCNSTDNKQITGTLYLHSDESTWMRMSNYTFPLFHCIVDEAVNRSQKGDEIFVSNRTAIECFLNGATKFPVSHLSCQVFCLAATLRVSLSHKMVSSFDLDMRPDDLGYRRRFLVANASHSTSSRIEIRAKCLQPMTSNWTDVGDPYVVNVTVAPTEDSHEPDLDLVLIIPLVTGVLTVALLSAVVVCVCRKRRTRRYAQLHPDETASVELVAPFNMIKTTCFYSKKDTWVTKKLFSILKKARDIELEPYLQAGVPYPEAIVDMMKMCDRIIIVISQNFLDERWQSFVSNQAIMENLQPKHKVIPINLDTSDMPSVLQQLVYLEPSDVDFSKRLLTAIREN